MNQANSHCNSSPASATSLPADAHSPALKAISTLAIQLRAIDSSIDNSTSHVPADSPQGESCNMALVICCLQSQCNSRQHSVWCMRFSARHITAVLLDSGLTCADGQANSLAGTSATPSGDSISATADLPPKHPASLPAGGAPAPPTLNGSHPASFSSRPLATQHGFQAATSPTHAEPNTSSGSHTISSAPAHTAVASSLLNSAGSNAPSSSTGNGLIGLAMQITASQPQIINSRQQLAIPAHLRSAGSHPSNSHTSSHFGASPASLTIPAPQAASNLTIAPLNMQPPMHLPATATQTAASEALLDLWDNGDPSGIAAQLYCITTGSISARRGVDSAQT